MTKWNDIPFNPDDTPEQKAENFDRQYEENRQDAGEDKSNPYDKDNFNK